MSKLQDIRELAQEHATLVSSSPRDWMGYMDTAARLYRYPFTDQLLIHAQHPQATACASLELWNEKMFRWVNRGARGIALLDENGHNTRLRYVFDISDTHMVAGGRSPYLWQMQEHQQEEIRMIKRILIEGVRKNAFEEQGRSIDCQFNGSDPGLNRLEACELCKP